jgi:hypothetical protein
LHVSPFVADILLPGSNLAISFFFTIQDDIGDKSVFMFNALPEEEKNALIQKLERQKAQQQFE